MSTHPLSPQNTEEIRDIFPDILRAEYQSIVAQLGESPTDEQLIGSLVVEADWTRPGAAEVVMLAQQYGTSVLRNALALADALDIEDGARGF